MKKTENKKIIETMEFDNYEYASKIYNESEKKLDKVKIGLIISAVATVVSIISLFLNCKNADHLLFVSWFGSIAAYIIGGGIKIVLKSVRKLAFFGWFILPFPLDIVTGLLTLVMAPIFFLFIPVVFVFINYLQVKKDRDAAQEYMSYFKPTTNEVI